MARLTKSDIEQELLVGKSVHWTEAAGKAGSIQLATAKQRRLYNYLKNSKVRDAKGLTPTFIDGLASAYAADGDPAAANIQQTINPSASGPWKIQKLKIEGFGGVNVWNGKPFELDLDCDSLLLDGPNGSGKSSLNAAIIWALTGDRPRDQGEGSLEEAKSVYDATGKAAGSWPPVASYPPDLSSLSTAPNVCVEIVFQNTQGKQASARRQFDGKTFKYQVDPALQIPSTLIEAGLLMPARMPHLRLGRVVN
jgi:AAA domain